MIFQQSEEKKLCLLSMSKVFSTCGGTPAPDSQHHSTREPPLGVVILNYLSTQKKIIKLNRFDSLLTSFVDVVVSDHFCHVCDVNIAYQEI